MNKVKPSRKREKGKRYYKDPFQNSVLCNVKAVLGKLWSFIQLYAIAIKWQLIEMFTKHQKFQPKEVRNPQLPKDVVVITGGEKGIGAETVKHLLNCDKHVVIGCKNPASAVKLVSNLRKEGVVLGSAECLYLDLASFACVKEFAQKIQSTKTSIYALINNASVMFVPFSLTEDGFEYHFQVNFLSHFLLTNLLLPLMVKRPANPKLIKKDERCARIVNVSSCVHYGGSVDLSDLQLFNNYSPHQACMNSKLLQLMISLYLDRKLRNQGLKVRCVAVHGFNVPWFQSLRSILRYFMRTAEQGADGVAYAAVSPRLENQGGMFLANCKDGNLRKKRKVSKCNMISGENAANT